ncbi:MAG: hypothetical protein Q8R02_07305 [Hyphomonadaceae bacterium]|nr:hypothetical protein [Hyphomonadaceae bacterium]
MKAFGGALALCCMSACGQEKEGLPAEPIKVERIVQVDSMPERPCVVRSLGEFQKTEKVSLWEFTLPVSGVPTSRQIEAASAEQGPWPATLNATEAGIRKPVWFDIYFRKAPTGLQMTMNFNDSGPAHDQSDISTTLRWMRKAEALILQTCGLTAKSPARESCGITPNLKCA